jgi:hypothetical protein
MQRVCNNQIHRGSGRSRLEQQILWVIMAFLLWSPPALAMQRYQADEWIAECGNRAAQGTCSIMVPFWQTAVGGQGSFVLVIMLQTGNVAIVGTPAPVKAVLRVDKGLPATCQGGRYCIFPAAQSLAIVRQLAKASLILIDVFTAKAEFSFSLSLTGYRAGIAQIQAWGYQVIAQ